jgi:hypothetical protein
MSPPAERWEIHPGLRSRFLAAGDAIGWRPVAEVAPRAPDRRVRVARLREEEARVEEWGTDADGGVTVDSGPLGALVLIIHVVRRGAPDALGAMHADREAAFPAGAIVAVWGDAPAPDDERPRPADVIELARYALE